MNDEMPSTDDQHLSRSIEWYSDGKSRIVEVGEVQITVRFVGRRGRRAGIAITAPPGVEFSELEKAPRAA